MSKPPRTNIDKELANVQVDHWSDKHGELPTDPICNDCRVAIKSLFLKWLEEIVGEEEVIHNAVHIDYAFGSEEHKRVRNKLRREIKERSKEMLG